LIIASNYEAIVACNRFKPRMGFETYITKSSQTSMYLKNS